MNSKIMTDEALQILSHGLELLHIPYDEKVLHALELYIHEIQKWGTRYRLVSKFDTLTLVRDHILDSLTVIPFIQQTKVHALLDIGSGAGFPGLCVKIVRADLSMTLLDARAHRIEFLKSVCRLLNLSDCSVFNVRLNIKGKNPLPQLKKKFDAILARGFSSLPELIPRAICFLKVGGRFILHRGSAAPDELLQEQELLATYQLEVFSVNESPFTLDFTDQKKSHKKRYIVVLKHRTQ